MLRVTSRQIPLVALSVPLLLLMLPLPPPLLLLLSLQTNPVYHFCFLPCLSLFASSVQPGRQLQHSLRRLRLQPEHRLGPDPSLSLQPR